MLFQRILQNTIRDHYRRTKVRSLWTTLLSALNPSAREEDEAHDPLESLETDDPAHLGDSPETRLAQREVMQAIENAVGKLPARQREAFLMRYWEEMDVAETAAAMGCTEGSVKTHCSRATHALAAALSAKGIRL